MNEFILVVIWTYTLLYKVEVEGLSDYIERCIKLIYIHMNRKEKCENCSWEIIDNDMRKCHLRECVNYHSTVCRAHNTWRC